MNSGSFRLEPEPVVYIVDDDPGSRDALKSIAESMQLKVLVFSSAEEFLSSYKDDTVSCLITDLRMQEMSGLDLLHRLREAGHSIQTIIISGFAETPVAVDAMQAGAVTFLEKSAPQNKISEAISRGLSLSRQLQKKKADDAKAKQIWKSFNAEERQVLRLVSAAKLNKEIAFELGVPLRTVEDRRRRLMNKIGAATVVDLIRFAIRIEELEQSGDLETR
jgi:FixJ family two-component response regulator